MNRFRQSLILFKNVIDHAKMERSALIVKLG